MQTSITQLVIRTVLITATLMVTARPALAGPPLLCFPFDIGAAKSLPMGTAGWQATDPKYDTARLVDDTLAILKSDTPVIVRMETIRRAVVYASATPKLGEVLLARLGARAKANADPLATFDYGYAVETVRQARPLFKTAIASIEGVDGYQLVVTALKQRPDPAMEFAAAVITQDGKRLAQHEGHRQRAKEGAKVNPALAATLDAHFKAHK